LNEGSLIEMSRNNDATNTWDSFFDDDYQDDYDLGGCDGSIGGGSDRVQQLLDDLPRTADIDAVKFQFAEAGIDADLEGISIGETAEICYEAELPDGDGNGNDSHSQTSILSLR
jgi:hypothetical protein